MKKNKIYHLSQCSTCQKIMSSLDTSSCEIQDIKLSTISEKELDQMAKMAGSYEALFSRKAIKYRTLGLKEKKLTEADYKKYILSEYTFLKRPVIVVGKKIFIGNAAKEVDQARAALNG
ncbi:MAG: arsenate reductase [Saprospiraceae bacterium]|jgi:arsenate reductase|nr:arsenate reductase [Saprospiraceae bacterium]